MTSQLITEINTQLPDNTTGAITPAIMRGVLTDMVNASVLETRSLIPTTTIKTDTVMVSGFTTAGDLGTDAIYTSKGATAGGPMAIQDAAGTWFNLVLNEPFNVGWFGAVADGTTDNSTAIQTALNLAETFGGTNPLGGTLGAQVYMPPGDYAISSPLVIPDRVSLRGSGKRSTVITAKANFSQKSSTVTITIAPPAVISWTEHGLIQGDAVVFQTTGALPTGLVAGTTYYVAAAGLGTDSFQLVSGDPFYGSAVNTSGTQNGVQTAFASTPVITLGDPLDTLAFDCFLEGLSVDGTSLAQYTIGVYSKKGQEGCGLTRVGAYGTDTGIYFATSGNGNILLREIECQGGNYGLKISGATTISVHKITALGTSIASAASIYLDRCEFDAIGVHCENATNGIYCAPNVRGSINGLSASSGANTTTNLLNYTSGALLGVRGLVQNSATNAVVALGVAFSGESTDTGPFYGQYNPGGGGGVISITPTGSPFLWQNTIPNRVNVVVEGGTVSLIEILRNVYVTTGVTTGIFPLGPGDYMRVTYSGTPTMTAIPF